MLTYYSTDDSSAETAAGTGAGFEYIVRCADGASAEALDAFRLAIGADLAETTRQWGFELWRSDTAIDADLLADCVDATWYEAVADSIEYIQPNATISAAGFTDDPKSGKLWGLHNTGTPSGTADADIDAPEAWQTSRGDGVVVAVIDTGVDYNHPDLAANMWVNPGEIAGNGIDDDGNGFVDDVHGYDFADNDSDPMDDHSHGTHVAGTIAAVADNGIGVVGVAPEARIMALRFLDSSGSGSIFDAIQALEYATIMGVKVSNNSWGGTVTSWALEDAINLAGDVGHTFVTASGNNGVNTDSRPHYPASLPPDNLIAVAATTPTDRLASYSNYGFTTVDVAAPGHVILSTAPGGGYTTKSGTSMAAPHVSGIVALMLANEPDLSPEEIRQRLIDTSDPISALASRSVSGGRVNAAAAVEAGAIGTLSGRIEDSSGAGLSDWLVYLDTDGNGRRDQGETATLTDGDGIYLFEGLERGTYRVAAQIAPGFALPTDSASYRTSDNGAPAWIDIASGDTRLELGDEGTASFALPTAFTFFGQSFESVTVTANGLLSFGDPGETFEITTLAEAPDWSIAPFWADLSTDHGGAVYFHADSASNQVIVQYDQVRAYSGAGSFTFQTILHADGDISFRYGDMNGIPAAARIGLRGGNATDVVSLSLDDIAPENGGLRLSAKPDTQIIREVEVTTATTAAPLTLVRQVEDFAEVGRITGLSMSEQSISFERSFDNPVVFLLTDGGATTSVAGRVLSVGSDGFSVALQAPGYVGAISQTQSLGYLVVEAGCWEMADGTRIEVGLHRTATLSLAGLDRVGFNHGFQATPLVFSQTQTANDPDYVYTRQGAADTDGVSLALEEEEAANTGTHGAETLGWLAIEPGSGSGVLETAQLDGDEDVITHDFATDFQTPPLLLSALATANGPDAARAVVSSVSAEGVTLSVMEDQSRDAETNHATETLNILALRGPGALSAQPASGQGISGTLWLDADGDGVQDTGEVGLAGRTLWLDTDNDGSLDATEITATTAADGSYTFAGLVAGQYTVRHLPPEGWSQTAPADGATYSLQGTPAGTLTVDDFSWNDITGAGVTLAGLGDDLSVTLDLPFLFPFFGTGHDSVTISANGYLTFGGDGGVHENSALDGNALPGPIIAAFWDDLVVSAGQVHAFADTAGDRFVVQFTDVQDYAGKARLTFQAILHSDGTILLQYLSMSGVLDNATVGIADGSGTRALQILHNSPGLSDEIAFTFAPTSDGAAAQTVIVGAGTTVPNVDFGTRPDAGIASIPHAGEAGYASDIFTTLITAAEAHRDDWA